MSTKHRRNEWEMSTGRHDREPSPGHALAIVSAIAGTLFGGLVGYIIATQQYIQQRIPVGAPAVTEAAALPSPTPAPKLVDEREIQTLRDILARDPKNAKAAIELGNRLYDAGRYGEAIPSYQQAFALDSRNVNVSTDLGTALWYSGRPDEALAQYDKSLAIDGNHAQTLFNRGIVRLEGKRNPQGAIESWEKLLAANPGYPETEHVRRLMDQARQQLGGRWRVQPWSRRVPAGKPAAPQGFGPAKRLAKV